MGTMIAKVWLETWAVAAFLSVWPSPDLTHPRLARFVVLGQVVAATLVLVD